MLFNSVDFLLFFVIVLVLYWILPHQVRYLWLLGASYYFYMQWNPSYLTLLLLSSIVAFVGGLMIDKTSDTNKRGRSCILVVCLVVCLGVLGLFKYANFGIGVLNRILGKAGTTQITWTSKLILPVGISFYTLQALGYLIDVYRKEIYVEKNFFRFTLFVSFFPQLVAGPIERSKNLLKQLGTRQYFSYENLRKGFLLMLWGMFVKVVIADRAAIFVDTVYGDYMTYCGFYIPIATVLFALQIYCDFYGYSTIARGAALSMGIVLVDNFNAPYFSRSIKEFWRRWHISLSSWFRDYLYIPLGGNRRGNFRKNVNLMLVFGVSGLWHGASLAYVFWGLLNGFYQIAADMIKPAKDFLTEKLRWEERLPEKVLKTIVTFLLISLTWLFFRAGDFSDAVEIIKSMFSMRNWRIFFYDDLYGLGIDRKYFGVLGISVLALGFVDCRKYLGYDVTDDFLRQNFWFRCSAEILLIFFILLFGCYGEMYDAANFIYFQF